MKRGTGKFSEEYIRSFAKVYNDIANYPVLLDVAAALDISYQTVRNRSSDIRRQARETGTEDPLISRSVIVDKPGKKLTPVEHAGRRAQTLKTSLDAMLTENRLYPIVNPEALVVEPYVSMSYDRLLGEHTPREGVPRTWLRDLLRVEPVADPRGRRFIFTGAQNDAVIHEGFWANLQAYAKAIDADIVVGPWTYETQWWSENNPNSRIYDLRLSDYLCFGRMDLGPNVAFCGEMNILPTASRPISDLASYSQGKCAIVPHSKVQLHSVPSLDPAQQARQVMTTGSVTLPKVIARKAGIKSIFHHIIGATILEFDEDGDFFPRQIIATKSGAFQDLDAKVKNGQVSFGHKIKALVAADIHSAKLNSTNSLAVFGFDAKSGRTAPGSLLEALGPEYVFVHDVHDQESRSHHREKDAAHNYEMAFRGRESVRDEVQRSVDFLRQLSKRVAKVKVVDSNHDLALERYAREGRYRLDGINMRYGLILEDAYLAWREQVAIALEREAAPPSFSLLEWAVRQIVGPDLGNVDWIYDGKSFVLDEVELGHHGFRGANGAKGTVLGFANMGRKMSIADKHSPAIVDGVYVAGVMELQHGYNKGPSGWAVTQIIQYPNGKRALVTLQNGKWRAPRLSR